MLPQYQVSTIPIKGRYLPPDDRENTDLVDYELGGIGLQDPSAGLSYQAWTLEYVGETVFVSAPNTPRVELFSRPDITEISLAFDQNMRPFVAFVEDNEAKFWWYDTVVGGPVFTLLPGGSRNPRACFDDRRFQQSASSDIVLAYLRDTSLYVRQQRERYLVEHLMTTEAHGKLIRVGMSNKNRLQFKFLPSIDV